jgi:AraC family transcriptional activator of mtrCDE
MDWLSRLLEMLPVRGTLDRRCEYGVPWRLAAERNQSGELPYHVVLRGRAVLRGVRGGPSISLGEGDILLLPQGEAHILHDGSGAKASPLSERPATNFIISENAGQGERLTMLCGRFVFDAQHHRLVRDYLPSRLVAHAGSDALPERAAGTATSLAGLMALMRRETDADTLGGRAMLNALSTALFTLSLRLAGEAKNAPVGLLATAANPRLAPALMAMMHEPARPWTLPELARLCNMSRAAFARHFQERLGRSASDFLIDIRMTLASNELRKPDISTAAVAAVVGYQSEAAFQRAFRQRMGVTPAAWRRTASSPPQPHPTPVRGRGAP